MSNYLTRPRLCGPNTWTKMSFSPIWKGNDPRVIISNSLIFS